MNKPRLLALPIVAGMVLALAVACGGSDDKPAASSDTGSNASKPVAAGDARTAPTGGGASQNQVLDLHSSAEKLMALRSFRFDLTMKLDFGGALPTGGDDDDEEDALGSLFAGAMLGALSDIKATGAFVAPDAAELQLTLGGQKAGFVTIGDKAWMKFGNAWQELDVDDSSGVGLGALSGSPSELIGSILPEEILEGAKTTREKVNGVQTTHYAFDKDSLSALAEKLGEEDGDSGSIDELTSASLDVWITDDNIPVKFDMALAATDEEGHDISIQLGFSIRDINDASIKVKPPV